jgi:hypothetical protein
MVQVMVNPGRRVRDKVNQRDAVGGDVIEVRDVERKILKARGYVSDPAPNDRQTPLRSADETQTPTIQVGTVPREEAATSAEPVAASEPSVGSELEPSRRRYRRRDMTAEES